MRRAQSMAQAAWSRPSLNLSSWSCIGPRHRANGFCKNMNEGETSTESSSIKAETPGPLLMSSQKTTSTMETIELPVPSSGGMVWNSEIEYSCSDEMDLHVDDDENLTGYNGLQDHMTEAELWQQLEHELYNTISGEEADVAKEISEEEAAAVAEVGESQRVSTVPEMEAHRFFPPGRVMHIVTFVSESDEVVCESDETTCSEVDSEQLAESKVGIFLAPRSLYSKIRLSQTMITDHFMPVYIRQIEKLIRELEMEEASVEDPLVKKPKGTCNW